MAEIMFDGLAFLEALQKQRIPEEDMVGAEFSARMHTSGFNCGIDIACRMLREQPTIEAEPVKHGKWEEFDCDYGGMPDVGYYCSECGHAEMTKYPYCNCGARMEVSR